MRPNLPDESDFSCCPHVALDQPHNDVLPVPPSWVALDLVRLISDIRDAEEAFDVLDNHIDPIRSEVEELLARLRLSDREGIYNSLPGKFRRAGLRLRQHELGDMAEYRVSLYITVAGQNVRTIVDAARSRYQGTRTSHLDNRPIVLTFTEKEWTRLSESWKLLPVDFKELLNKVKHIHDAAKIRQSLRH